MTESRLNAAARDHVHVLASFRPYQSVGEVVQWLKGINSRVLLQEFPHLKKRFWGRHFRARGYLAVSSGTITDEMVKAYIDGQEASGLRTIVNFQLTTDEPLGFRPKVVQLKEPVGWKPRVMVDRYAKFASGHLSAAASRIESARIGDDGVYLTRFPHGEQADKKLANS